MAITDAERHKLHSTLQALVGEEDAAVLMEHLPPSGWSDVARIHDLAQLEARVDLRLEQLEARTGLRLEAVEHKLVAAFEHGLREQTNRYTLMMGVMLSVLVTVQTLFG